MFWRIGGGGELCEALDWEEADSQSPNQIQVTYRKSIPVHLEGQGTGLQEFFHRLWCSQ